jgi:predicted phage-related endonuclease
MKIYKDLVQGSTEWRIVRQGLITGTKLKEVFKANNLDLIDELIAERISDEIEENYTNKAMERGTELEPVARNLYSEITGCSVEEIGFAVSNEFNFLGLSPDGLIKNSEDKYIRGVEIKCPNTSIHVRYIRQNSIPNEYKYQVLNYFLVCQDLEALDFVSYDDRFQIKPMHIITLTREELKTEIENAKIELYKFWAKFEKYYSQVVFG